MQENQSELTLSELRQMWTEAWGCAPHARIGRTMLEKSLVFKRLEREGQVLTLEQFARLNNLIKTYRQNPARFGEQQVGLKEGTRLVRMWRGTKHIVTVTGNEFEYLGMTYNSLSRIAGIITGKSWNGWVFFGLKVK